MGASFATETLAPMSRIEVDGVELAFFGGGPVARSSALSPSRYSSGMIDRYAACKRGQRRDPSRRRHCGRAAPPFFSGWPTALLSIVVPEPVTALTPPREAS